MRRRLRRRRIRGQRLEHDQRIHIAERSVRKRTRQSAHDGKAELEPQAHRLFVGGHDEVELHRAKAHRARLHLRVLAQSGGNALAARRGCRDVSAVAHMRAEPRLVRLDEIAADDATAVAAGDKGGRRRLDPGKVDAVSLLCGSKA
jgi:hypothetical protein